MTLNNIISIFRGFAKTHGQINTFFYGDPLKFLNKKDVVYPAMVLFLSDGIKISRRDKLTTYPFKIYIIDLLHTIDESEENMADLDSDLSSIAQDIAAMAIDISRKNFEFNTSGEYSGAFLENQFDDLTISFCFDMTIGTLFNSNRCQVPDKSIIVSPKSLVYNPNTTTIDKGIIGSSVLPSINSGRDTIIYSISNCLGVTIDRTTGIISWDDTVVVGTHILTITATNSISSISTEYTLIVNDIPVVPTYDYTTYYYSSSNDGIGGSHLDFFEVNGDYLSINGELIYIN